MTTTIPSSRPGAGKERLQRALQRIGRPSDAPSGRRRPAATRGPVLTAAPAAEPVPVTAAPEAAVEGRALPAELLDLVERLDSIADRLADLEQPGRPLPATRAVFAEWVRLRKWEEIPFSEFLTLRRAGRI